MDFAEIIRHWEKGRYVIWVDDKSAEPVTPEYLTEHFVSVSDSLDGAYSICKSLHDSERIKLGKAISRYRISRPEEDYVASEDLDVETISRMIREMPVSEEDKTTSIEH